MCLIGIHNYQTYTYLHVLYVNDSLGNVNIGLIPRPLFPTPRWPGYEALLLCVQTSLTEAQLANTTLIHRCIPVDRIKNGASVNQLSSTRKIENRSTNRIQALIASRERLKFHGSVLV